MDSGDIVLIAVGVVFAVGFAGLYAWADRANRRRLAGLEAVWSSSREVIAAAPPGAQPMPAVLTGRPALAYHVEVVTKERLSDDEVITRRVHEESGGGFDCSEGYIDFSNASLTTEADADFGGPVVYSSATSMFAGAQQIPQPVYAFLAQRNLPLPRQDQLFAAGFKVVIRERIIAPGTHLWLARADDGTSFDLGSIEEARRSAKSKQSRPIFDAALGAVILGAFAGLIASIAVGMLSK